ncbi:MAG: GNAT family N-acetyltransferase [Anaerolineae bacterium]
MHKLLTVLPDTLTTERLTLRPYRAGDGPWYYQMSLRNREHLSRYESGNAAMFLHSDEDAEVAVRQFALDWAARNAFFMGAFLRETREFVAQVYIGVMDWDVGSFVVGYICDVEHVGQGYVTEAVQGALRMIFGPLQGRRVSIYCDDTNLRSARVAERCGFLREGHLRGNHRHGDYPVSGDYIYGLLRDDWLAQGGVPLPGPLDAAGRIAIRPLTGDDIGRWLEIDRRELIEAVYYLEDGTLVLRPERYDVQGWFQPADELERMTIDLKARCAQGAFCVAAWDSDRIAGVIVLDNTWLGPQHDQLQLSLLHVSHDYRDQGLGARLFEIARSEARRRGARDMYVSATPSEHTVRFYLGRGCRLNPAPDPALFAAEPEDIHLLCAV